MRGTVIVALLLASAPARAAFDPDRSSYVAVPGQPMEGLHDYDWARAAPDLLPVMAACMAGDAKSFVLVARWMNHGRALARLELGDGSRQDCVAEDLGHGEARVESRTPVPAGSHMPGEGMPAWFRDRNPGCVDARRVSAPDGRVLGWLAYPECR